MLQTYSQVWDLDVIFPGGSSSTYLDQHLKEIKRDFPALKEKILALDITTDAIDVSEWSHCINGLQEMSGRISEASAFISCLNAQNARDEQAQLLRGKSTQLLACLQSVQTSLESKITKLTDKAWSRLIEDERLQPISYQLSEIRTLAKEKLSADQEALVSDLSVDGYHSWGQMYNKIVGQIQIPIEENGEVVYLSAGQAANKMDHPDRSVRQKVFKAWEAAWQQEAPIFSTVLNHIAGYRLQLYKHRGWDSVLKEPLDDNRMKKETLEVMWAAIEDAKQRLIPYLERKAELLGVKRLGFSDVYAPLPGDQTSFTYDEAAQFIFEQFNTFHPDMANFSRKAFEERWIEAEDRPGKRPGGFCTSFPLKKQTRIFMTFAGTSNNVSTLAHELGHAYHQYVMTDLPLLAQKYAMNVAETASTFAELLVTDAAIKQAESKETKITLLEDKLQRAVAFFMDIHTRFLFETRFYEARKQGPVSAEDLCSLMIEAQKEGFAGILDEYHPHFWASKLHFYNTYVPFYNFPYTFGFLFSMGIYARSLSEGDSFAEKYVQLLRDTGSMTVEDLAMKHLGVDLTQRYFWDHAVELVLADVKEFLALTE